MKKVIMGVFALAVSGFALVSCGSESDDTPSPVKPNEPVTEEGDFVHKVLLEDVTSISCVACPYAAKAIDELHNLPNGENVIAVAAHVKFGKQLIDPMRTNFSEALSAYFQVSFYPFVRINRSEVWSNQGFPKGQVLKKVQKSSPVGIKISSDLKAAQGTVSASFKFREGYEDLKYSIYILENGIVSPQVVGQGGQAVLDHNYTHNHVLRASGFNNPAGSEIGTVTKGQEVKKAKKINYTLMNGDLSKVDVVVFVTDKDGKVLNAQIAHANETTEYEMK